MEKRDIPQIKILLDKTDQKRIYSEIKKLSDEKLNMSFLDED